MWLLTQSCPTLCNPRDSSPPGSSVHGILQARMLAISFSRGSSWPRDQTCISCVSCTAGRFFTPMSHLRNDTTFFLFFSYLTFFAAPLLILLQDCQPLLSLYHLESLTLRFSLFAFKESQSSPWLQLLRLQTPMVRVASCNVWQHHTASYTNVQLPLNALPPHLQNHPIHYPILSTSPAKLLLSPFVSSLSLLPFPGTCVSLSPLFLQLT